MTSNNSNNVNNANGGESGNSADGAIEGVAIEAAANVTGSEQRQAAVNDAAVADGSVTNGSAGGWGVEPGSAAGRADGGQAAADNGGTDEYAGNRADGLGDAEWAAGTGAAGCGTVGYGSAGYRLAAAPGSSGYAPNGPMPRSYGEGSRAAWYVQNAPTQAMNPQPGNMQAVSGQNMNAQGANMQGANTPDANAQGGRMPLCADWNGRGPVPGAMGGQVPTLKGSKGGEHALSGKTWALLAVVSLVCGLVGGVGGALAVNALTDDEDGTGSSQQMQMPGGMGQPPSGGQFGNGQSQQYGGSGKSDSQFGSGSSGSDGSSSGSGSSYSSDGSDATTM